MNHSNHEKDDRRTDSRSSAESVEDRRAALKAVTQDTRFNLIQDILGHPEKQPSLNELDYVNPSKSRSTISEHLGELRKHNIVQETELPQDARSRDLPWKFFSLTDDGRAFLAEQNLLMAEKKLEELYSKVEKTEKVKKYEEAPRPELDDRTVVAPP